MIKEVATAKMPSGGAFVLIALLAAVGVTTPATAQEKTPERRLVQAFHAYCIATAAAPGRVQTEIGKVAKFESRAIMRHANGGHLESGEVVDAVGQRDPHQRMLVAFGWGLGESGRRLTCQVNMPWGEKTKLVAELVANLSLADGTSSVIREGQYDTDLTRWTTRIGNAEAVIELGMPTYAGAAGRALTLTVDGQEELRLAE
jgi:hypothetical protein